MCEAFCLAQSELSSRVTMSDTVIRVENLSKLYHIGRASQRPDSLREAVVAALRFRLPVAGRREPALADHRRLLTDDNARSTTEDDTIWALITRHGRVC